MRLKSWLSALFLLVAVLNVQAQSYTKEIKAFQEELDHEYKSPEESPLKAKDRKKFKGHPYFSINEKYRVEAHFTRSADPMTFQMQTSTSRMPKYDKYGTATFELDGKTYTLTIYQSHKLRETEQYKDYLFLPFTDLTNGEETYEGGRYIDLRITEGDKIVIDFNKAYQPYCAYNDGYSCPVPPAENDLDTRIEAGVKHLKYVKK